MHGFALNVSGDLDWFRHIVPCGLAGRAVASVSGVAGRRVSIEEMVAAVVPRFAAVFGHETVEAQMAAFTRGAGRASRVVRGGPVRERRGPHLAGEGGPAGSGGGPSPRGAGASRLDAGARRPGGGVPGGQGPRRRAGPAHRVPGSGLPQHLRVLGGGHRDLPADGGGVHPGLLLLRRGHRPSGAARPGGAGAGGRGGGPPRPAPRRAHLGGPRRPSRRRGGALRRRHRAHPGAGAGVRRRGADPGLQGGSGRPGDGVWRRGPRC